MLEKAESNSTFFFCLMALCTLPLWLPFLLLLPILILILKKKMVMKKQVPPGPPRLPIVGNLHQLGGSPHRSFWQLSQKHGPVMFLKLGCVPTVVVSSAEAAREVLKIHDLDCCSRPQLDGSRILSYNFLDIALTPYGDYWREMRKTCVLKLFSAKRVQSFRFIREEEVASLINSISQASSSAAAVDLTEKFFHLTASVTSRIAFGKSFKGSSFDNDRFQQVVHEAVAVNACFSASQYFPYIGWIVDKFTGVHERFERIFRKMDGFLQQAIDDHSNLGRTKQEQEDIVDVLLRIERNQNDFGATRLTKDHVKAVLMDIFLAGVDTGAITLIWAMAELARNPRLMKKAQDEVRNCVGKKGKVAESDIDQLQYLKMIVKETLRLHPPAPLLLPRETMSHCKINGYNIKPKTLLQINVWAIGRDPKYWKNPEEFMPERFSDSSVDYKGQHFELLPFGGGRRGCPGTYMATALVELTLANLLHCFDWKLPGEVKEEEMNMEEENGVSLTVSKKIALNLIPINNFLQTSKEDTS